MGAPQKQKRPAEADRTDTTKGECEHVRPLPFSRSERKTQADFARGGALSISLRPQWLGPMGKAAMKVSHLTYDTIARATCQHFEIDSIALKSRRRDRAHFFPRAIVAHLARRFTPLSSPEIGDRLHVDHSSVLNADKRARELAITHQKFAGHLAAVELILSVEPAPLSREERLRRDWHATLPAAAKVEKLWREIPGRRAPASQAGG